MSSSNPLRQRDAIRRLPNPREPKIAFALKRDGSYQVYVMDAVGGHQTRLITSPFQHRFPVWSPDGKKIAFGSQRPGAWELWVMNADGSNPVFLTRNMEAN